MGLVRATPEDNLFEIRVKGGNKQAQALSADVGICDMGQLSLVLCLFLSALDVCLG